MKTIAFQLTYRVIGLGDIHGFVQLIPGNCKSDKPINITGIDKVHLKCVCIYGSILNGIRHSNLNSFVLSALLGYKIHKELRIKLFKKTNKPVLSQITFYLEDDDHKSVNFNNETISVTCQSFIF